MARTRTGEGGLSPATRKHLAHVRACERSGETLKDYAERHGLRVHSLYHAKKLARKHGLLPPHRRQKGTSPTRHGSPAPRFVEAVRRVEPREGGAVWRVRFSSGAVLESSVPLPFEQTLRLIGTLEGRG